MRRILVITAALTTLLCSSYAGITLEWEVDMTNYVAGATSAGRIKQYVDGSVALMVGDNDGENLVVLNSNGSLRFVDAEINMSVDEIFGHASDSNHIMLWCADSSSGYQSYLRLYSYTNDTFSVTNLPMNSASPRYANSGIDNSYVFLTEGTVLRKYSLSSPPAHIDGAVASGIDGSNYVLHWDSEVGAQYQIQSSTNLTNWVDVGSPITGTGSALTWANALTNPSSFFRVIKQ